jgi:hypothetical protein
VPPTVKLVAIDDSPATLELLTESLQQQGLTGALADEQPPKIVSPAARLHRNHAWRRVAHRIALQNAPFPQCFRPPNFFSPIACAMVTRLVL